MALSEHEQQLLDQLEASLAADDPMLAQRLRGGLSAVPARGGRAALRPGPGGEVHARRVGGCVAGLLVGLAGLFGGMQVHPVVGLLGFAVMLVSLVVLSDDVRAASLERDELHGPGPSHPAHEGLERAAERWRQEEGR
ncbi:hypothetical protein GCM10027030_14670 [Luteococcus sediminum]